MDLICEECKAVAPKELVCMLETKIAEKKSRRLLGLLCHVIEALFSSFVGWLVYHQLSGCIWNFIVECLVYTIGIGLSSALLFALSSSYGPATDDRQIDLSVVKQEPQDQKNNIFVKKKFSI